MTLYVNVYNAAQAYGGPEEGGWWFDTGVPVASIPVELTEQEEQQARDDYEATYTEEEDNADTELWIKWRDEVLTDKADKVWEEWKARYPFDMKQYTSVLSHRYDNYQVVIEDHFARPYPEHRPHYE